MMKIQRIILIFEIVLILVPVSLMASYGALYIIGIGIAEKLRIIPLQAATMMFGAVVCLLAIVSLWFLAVGSANSKNQATRNLKSFIYIPAHLGAGIAFLSLLSAFSWLVFPEQEGLFASLAMFAFGSPALIPYLHAIYIKNHANKAI